MNRFIFAVALAGLATSSTHAFAQERVARVGAVKPARTAAADASQKKTTATKGAPTVSNTGDGSTLAAPTDDGSIARHPGQDLADVRGHEVTSDGSGAEERTIVTAAVVQNSNVPRMIATPRLLRRMNADRTILKLAEDFHACYVQEPAAKSADAAVVRLDVSPSGAVESAHVESGATATARVTACISAAATSGKFGAPGGIGTAVLVQVRAR